MTSKLARNTLYLTVASISQKAIAFIYFLVVARLMMPEKTGIYFLAVSIAMIFSVIADFGVTPVVIREIAKEPENTQKYFQRALALKIPLLVIGYLGALIVTIVLGYDITIIKLVSITGIVLALDSFHLLFYGVLRGHHKLIFESIGMFFGQIVTTIFGLITLWLSPSLFLLSIALVLGSLTNVLISGSALVRMFGFSLFVPKLNTKFAISLLRAAFPFALAAIFVKVYSYIDTVFISKFLDTTAVGLYSVAYKFTYAFQFLPLAFVAVLYPSFSSTMVTDPNQLRHMFDRAIWYVLILVTPIVFGIWLIADRAVLLAGGSYSSSAIVLSVLIFVLFPIFLDFPIGALLNAANRQSTKTAIMGVTMIINIILNYILIPRFGIIGAAYSALVSFSVMFIIGMCYVPKVIKSFSFFSLIKNSVGTLFSGIIMALVGVYIMPIVGWIAVIPICGALYLIMLFLTRTIKKTDLIILFDTIKR